MNHRGSLVALGASTICFAFFLAACGDYSQPDSSTGGASGTGQTGGMSTGGTMQGGTGGASGGASGGQSGSGVTGGMAGGGQAGTGMTGGAAGSPGGSGGSGGSGGGAMCADAAPCGGDLVGTWTIQSCPLALTEFVNTMGFGLVLSCMAPITTGSLELTGSLTFNADMTLVDMTSMTGEVTFELGADCLEISGTETTCDEIDGPLSSNGFDMLTCTDNPTTLGCTCEGVIEQQYGFGYTSFDADAAGTHMAMGNQVALKWFGDPVDYSYCVGGNTLTMTMDSVPPTGTVDGPIVLQKQ